MESAAEAAIALAAITASRRVKKVLSAVVSWAFNGSLNTAASDNSATTRISANLSSCVLRGGPRRCTVQLASRAFQRPRAAFCLLENAETDRILATPTLIKQLPPPLRRVIGDLSDKDKVLLGLEVRTDNSRPKA